MKKITFLVALVFAMCMNISAQVECKTIAEIKSQADKTKILYTGTAKTTFYNGTYNGLFMEDEVALISALVVVLACALVVLLIGRKFRLPFIIGYFLTGIIVGPFGLGLIAESEVSMLAELGVILLMFTIGLEISLKNLLAMKKIVLIGGMLQLVITTVAVLGVMMAVGFSFSVALFIGFLVAHSSTAIIMDLYQRSGEVDSRHGKIALGYLFRRFGYFLYGTVYEKMSAQPVKDGCHRAYEHHVDKGRLCGGAYLRFGEIYIK